MPVLGINSVTNPAQLRKMSMSMFCSCYAHLMTGSILRKDPYNTDLYYSIKGVKTLADAKKIVKESRTAGKINRMNFFSLKNSFYDKNANIALMNRNTNKSAKELLKEEELLTDNQKVNGINFEISDYRQGLMGDCWLLASLESLSNNAQGKKIIKNSIFRNKDGTYSVKFKGINKIYTFTKEDIQKQRENEIYSRGDDDVLLIELAFEKFRTEVNSGKMNLPNNAPDNIIECSENKLFELDGGNFSQVIYLLTGDKSKFKMNYQNYFDKLFYKFDKNPNKYIAVIGFGGPLGLEGCLTVKDVNGNDVVLSKDDRVHCWSIKKVDKDTVTLINPWDSSKEFTISKTEVKKYAIAIEYYSP